MMPRISLTRDSATGW